MLRRLEPLTSAGVPRELLVSAGKWTAYFNNSLYGTDAEPVIGYLTEALSCQGVVVDCAPTVVSGKEVQRYGAVQFSLFGPLRTDWLNYVRSVGVAYDDRWEFFATGVEQPFEEPEAYEARRIRDRFTSGMLERYCQALGIDVFNPDAYGPEAVYLEQRVPYDLGRVRRLSDVQEELGIVPGLADDLPE